VVVVVAAIFIFCWLSEFRSQNSPSLQETFNVYFSRVAGDYDDYTPAPLSLLFVADVVPKYQSRSEAFCVNTS
jgi:hypothetical protein